MISRQRSIRSLLDETDVTQKLQLTNSRCQSDSVTTGSLQDSGKLLQNMEATSSSSYYKNTKVSESQRRPPIDPTNSFRKVTSPFVVPQATRRRGKDAVFDAAQDDSEGDWVLSGDELGVSSVEDEGDCTFFNSGDDIDSQGNEEEAMELARQPMMDMHDHQIPSNTPLPSRASTRHINRSRRRNTSPKSRSSSSSPKRTGDGKKGDEGSHDRNERRSVTMSAPSHRRKHDNKGDRVNETSSSAQEQQNIIELNVSDLQLSSISLLEEVSQFLGNSSSTKLILSKSPMKDQRKQSQSHPQRNRRSNSQRDLQHGMGSSQIQSRSILEESRNPTKLTRSATAPVSSNVDRSSSSRRSSSKKSRDNRRTSRTGTTNGQAPGLSSQHETIIRDTCDAKLSLLGNRKSDCDLLVDEDANYDGEVPSLFAGSSSSLPTSNFFRSNEWSQSKNLDAIDLADEAFISSGKTAHQTTKFHHSLNDVGSVIDLMSPATLARSLTAPTSVSLPTASSRPSFSSTLSKKHQADSKVSKSHQAPPNQLLSSRSNDKERSELDQANRRAAAALLPDAPMLFDLRESLKHSDLGKFLTSPKLDPIQEGDGSRHTGSSLNSSFLQHDMHAGNDEKQPLKQFLPDNSKVAIVKSCTSERPSESRDNHNTQVIKFSSTILPGNLSSSQPNLSVDSGQIPEGNDALVNFLKTLVERGSTDISLPGSIFRNEGGDDDQTRYTITTQITISNESPEKATSHSAVSRNKIGDGEAKERHRRRRHSKKRSPPKPHISAPANSSQALSDDRYSTGLDGLLMDDMSGTDAIFQRDRQWPTEWLQTGTFQPFTAHGPTQESLRQNRDTEFAVDASKTIPIGLNQSRSSRAYVRRGSITKYSVQDDKAQRSQCPSNMSVVSSHDDVDDDASPRSAFAFDESFGQREVKSKGKLKDDAGEKFDNFNWNRHSFTHHVVDADFCNIEYESPRHPESHRSITSSSVLDSIARNAYSQEPAYWHDFHEDDNDDDSFPMDCLLTEAAHFQDDNYYNASEQRRGRRLSFGSITPKESVLEKEKVNSLRRHSSDSYNLKSSLDQMQNDHSRDRSRSGSRGRSPKKDKKKKKKKKGIFRRRLSLDSRMNERESTGDDQGQSNKKRKQRRRSLPSSSDVMKIVMSPAKHIVKRTKKRISKTPSNLRID